MKDLIINTILILMFSLTILLIKEVVIPGLQDYTHQGQPQSLSLVGTVFEK